MICMDYDLKVETEFLSLKQFKDDIKKCALLNGKPIIKTSFELN
jgi:hypothetical protein